MACRDQQFKSLHQRATMYIVLLILSTQPFISIHVHVTHANAHQSTDVFFYKENSSQYIT